VVEDIAMKVHFNDSNNTFDLYEETASGLTRDMRDVYEIAKMKGLADDEAWARVAVRLDTRTVYVEGVAVFEEKRPET
jgi:hypothetical protein